MRAQDKSGGALIVNFNPAALEASQEVLIWVRLRMNIPCPALELNAQYDRHHVMRVKMASLVTLYNRVRDRFHPPGLHPHCAVFRCSPLR